MLYDSTYSTVDQNALWVDIGVDGARRRMEEGQSLAKL